MCVLTPFTPSKQSNPSQLNSAQYQAQPPFAWQSDDVYSNVLRKKNKTTIPHI